MESSIILIGVGEMGAVFAHGLLRTGHPIRPVLRATPVAEIALRLPEPELVLVTVGEDDLHDVLAGLPTSWRSRTALIQNELLPPDWQRHGITDPTVAVVWFEKKPGRATKVIIPTPVAGPAAAVVVEALHSIDIAAVRVESGALLDALIAKNLYILTANITGLSVGGTVSDLWSRHRDLAGAVAREILDVQEWLVGRPIDRDRAMAGMLEAFEGDPDHASTGRSAPRRLDRAISHAQSADIAVPTLLNIGREAGLSV